MEGWTEKVERILDRAPTRALPFSRVLESLRSQGATVVGREGWVLQRMVEDAETFKVIPDRLGPWVAWPDSGHSGTSTRGSRSRSGAPARPA